MSELSDKEKEIMAVAEFRFSVTRAMRHAILEADIEQVASRLGITVETLEERMSDALANPTVELIAGFFHAAGMKPKFSVSQIKPPESYGIGADDSANEFEFDVPGPAAAVMLDVIKETTGTPLESMIAVEMLKLSLDRIFGGMAHDRGMDPKQYEEEKLTGWTEATRIAAEIVARHIRD